MSYATTELEVLNTFKTNVTNILHAQNLSPAELSRRAGLEGQDAVSALLRGDALPNMLTPMRIADALGVPVDALLRDSTRTPKPAFEALSLQDVDHQAARFLCAVFEATEQSIDRVTDRPTLDAIISWWKDNDGDLSRSDQISPHFDLVRAADALSAIPKIHHVGALGLSATTLGAAENARLEKFLETLSTSDIEELNGHIRTVGHTGVGMITPQSRIVQLPETNETIEVSFVRLMLPVKDTAGTPFVLNYSALLSESKPSKLDG